jgi:putative oxidoreductase
VSIDPVWATLPGVSTHDGAYDDTYSDSFSDSYSDPYGGAHTDTDAFSDVDEEPLTRENKWHGGLDLGLLITRIALGGAMGAHGLQHVFGLFGGSGIDNFGRALRGLGFVVPTTLLPWIVGVAELAGGALVILGLFTPLGAAALLSVAADVVYAKFHGGFFEAGGKGYEFDLVLGALALSLLCSGAGRISLEVNTPWRRRPWTYGLFGFFLAAAGSAAVIVFFR